MIAVSMPLHLDQRLAGEEFVGSVLSNLCLDTVCTYFEQPKDGDSGFYSSLQFYRGTLIVCSLYIDSRLGETHRYLVALCEALSEKNKATLDCECQWLEMLSLWGITSYKVHGEGMYIAPTECTAQVTAFYDQETEISRGIFYTQHAPFLQNAYIGPFGHSLKALRRLQQWNNSTTTIPRDEL
jgi:hypothetical protein